MNELRLFKFEKNNCYTHFLIYVAKAAQKVDKKYGHKEHLARIFCDGNRIVATDGRRLHVYTPDECPIPKGFYLIEKKTKTCLHLSSTEDDSHYSDIYPDIDKVIPERDNLLEFKNHDTDSMISELLRGMPSGTVNINYFLDSVSVGGIESFRAGDGIGCVAMYGDYTLSIIMPKR